MRFETWVGVRYLMSKRSSRFVSFIAIMTVLGVVIGVAALNVTLAVMTGFEEDLQAKILGMNAHGVVRAAVGDLAPDDELVKRIRKIEGVTGVTPFTRAEMLIQQGNQVTGMLLRGTDPSTIGEVSEIVGSICLERELDPCGEEKGTRLEDRQAILSALDESYEINDGTKIVPGVILGDELAGQLYVRPGETVQLLAPGLATGPGGSPFPKVRTFYVIGLFHTGMWEYDQKFALSSIGAAQKMSGTEGRISGLEFRTNDMFEADDIAAAVGASLGEGFVAASWQETNGALFSALALEKFVMGLLLTLIVIVASFSIVSILTLIVMEKAKEIAIVKTMGASNNMVLGVFATQGFAIGVAGVLLGSALGYAGSFYLRWLEFELDPSVYVEEHLPVAISAENFLMVGVAGLLITFVAGLPPSFVAARQRVVQGLAHE